MTRERRAAPGSRAPPSSARRHMTIAAKNMITANASPPVTRWRSCDLGDARGSRWRGRSGRLRRQRPSPPWGAPLVRAAERRARGVVARSASDVAALHRRGRPVRGRLAARRSAGRPARGRLPARGNLPDSVLQVRVPRVGDRRGRAAGGAPLTASLPQPLTPSSSVSSLAAASGSWASVIARTTTLVARPRCDGRRQCCRVEPADREPRLAHRVRPRTPRTRVPRPGGRAWSASRGRGRPRCSRRRRRRRPRRPARARGWSGRRSGPGRPSRAPPRASRRPGPTCTPSAPHASTRSGRSLRTKSAPCASAAARKTFAASINPSSDERLVAQLDQVDAAAQRRVEERRVGARRRRGTGGWSASRSRGVMRRSLAALALSASREPANGLRGRHQAADRRT